MWIGLAGHATLAVTAHVFDHNTFHYEPQVVTNGRGCAGAGHAAVDHGSITICQCHIEQVILIQVKDKVHG